MSSSGTSPSPAPADLHGSSALFAARTSDPETMTELSGVHCAYAPVTCTRVIGSRHGNADGAHAGMTVAGYDNLQLAQHQARHVHLTPCRARAATLRHALCRSSAGSMPWSVALKPLQHDELAHSCTDDGHAQCLRHRLLVRVGARLQMCNARSQRLNDMKAALQSREADGFLQDVYMSVPSCEPPPNLAGSVSCQPRTAAAGRAGFHTCDSLGLFGASQKLGRPVADLVAAQVRGLHTAISRAKLTNKPGLP